MRDRYRLRATRNRLPCSSRGSLTRGTTVRSWRIGSCGSEPPGLPFGTSRERDVSEHPIIRVQHLAKSFGAVAAVNDVSFDVQPGEVFAFLGPNGAGKTTTIKMLTTLLRPTTGSLELDGLDVTTQQMEARKRFGVVFQDPSLDSELTAWENMDIHGVLYHVPRNIRQARIEELLKFVELWDRR